MKGVGQEIYKIDTTGLNFCLSFSKEKLYHDIKAVKCMLRMEIALFLVLGFIACLYFSAEKKHTPLHQTFSALLIVALIHVVFDRKMKKTGEKT